MSEEIITSNHWLVITNPTAGKRKFQVQSKFVKKELDKAGIPYLFKWTEYSGHAIEIAKIYTRRGCLNFLVLGGDGTISEVINGIFATHPDNTSKIKIALLPRGTGNDWGRYWNLKKNDKESMEVFLKSKTQLIDIGKIDFLNDDAQMKEHFFINSIGFGLDAEVVDMTQKLKKFFGSFSLLYTFALLLAVFKYKSVAARLIINDNELSQSLFTMNIANGPYTGGGIKQNPSAVPYDGYFDMMIVEKPTLKDILVALTQLSNGKLANHPALKTYQTKEVAIDLKQRILVEADGILLNNAHNCKVSIIPSAIQMVVP